MEAVVRRLTRADLPQYAALSAFAFQVDEQAQRGALRLLPPVALGAFTPDGDRLLAALRIWPFLAYFQGRPVPTGGVASVASWPEVRRQGLVGRLIRESLELMRAEGQAVSALYPFSYPFYRRYGWDLAFTQTLYQIPMGELDAFRRPPGGHFRPAEPDDLPALDALYRRFVRRWNGPLLRESSWWQQRVLNHPGRPRASAPAGPSCGRMTTACGPTWSTGSSRPIPRSRPRSSACSGSTTGPWKTAGPFGPSSPSWFSTTPWPPR